MKESREGQTGNLLTPPYFCSLCCEPPFHDISLSLSASSSSSSHLLHTCASQARICREFSPPSLPKLPIRAPPQTSHHLVLKFGRTRKNPTRFRWIGGWTEARTHAQGSNFWEFGCYLGPIRVWVSQSQRFGAVRPFERTLSSDSRWGFLSS